jgi:hypothetical protein
MNTDKKIKHHVYLNPASRKFEFYLRQGDAYALPLHMKTGSSEDSGMVMEPFLKLEPEEAQILIDALYDAGLRPVGANGSQGQLAAVQYHLEDMRKLVFNNAFA